MSEPIGRVLKKYPEVKLALLFGSRAKGRERPDSDLDLALQGEDLDLLALIRGLTLATGLEVDVVDLSQAGHTLQRILLRDSIVVYEGAPGATATWRRRHLAPPNPPHHRARPPLLRAHAERLPAPALQRSEAMMMVDAELSLPSSPRSTIGHSGSSTTLPSSPTSWRIENIPLTSSL